MSTIMEEARRGITPLVKRIAEKERMSEEFVRNGIASGRIVVPCNPIHNPEPGAVGEGMSIKVNVNLGTSRDMPDMEPELRKLDVALKYGADAVMDLSTGGDVDGIRKEILSRCPVMVGTVPIYQTGLIAARKDAVVEMTEDDIFNGIEKQAKEGVDFMTVHCGITKQTVDWLKRSGRIMDVVSRGGSFLTAWILHNEQENPLYSNFGYLLEMCRKYEITLSLGDGFRPGCIDDASDAAQISELMTLGRLVEKCREAGVQSMVEGPGHMPLDQIEANMVMQKTLCHNAPFYVLGPLVTDIAPGYDHIVGAIGGTIAAKAGADFLCYLTPAEHLSLPDAEDVREGLIASKIAAHVGDMTRGKGHEADTAMARARKALDWEAMYEVCLDREKAERYRERGCTKKEDGCSMCGDICAVKIVNKYLTK
ncbi:MAG: phosphomethylpyrimidine synthase ThiC [Candidatus Methanomethylophilaceae archaeon]|jgi:phosphomethylpyrimidine synthase|nr:phosphomethylpyrimidine synthase ThiC [Candidatus Methanomethylophilaceae archaeon]